MLNRVLGLIVALGVAGAMVILMAMVGFISLALGSSLLPFIRYPRC